MDIKKIIGITLTSIALGCAPKTPILNKSYEHIHNEGGVYIKGKVVEYDASKSEIYHLPYIARMFLGGRIEIEGMVTIMNDKGQKRKFFHPVKTEEKGWEPITESPKIGDQVLIYLGKSDYGRKLEDYLSIDIIPGSMEEAIEKIKLNALETWEKRYNKYGLAYGETKEQAENRLKQLKKLRAKLR